MHRPDAISGCCKESISKRRFSDAGFNCSSSNISGCADAGWLLSLIHISLYYRLLRRDRDVLKSEELRFYTVALAVATVLIAVNIAPGLGSDILLSIRQSAFQVVSVATTTGYASADFDAWPHFSRVLLFFLMFLGACGGSTGGGIKQTRLLLLLKHARRELLRLIHPSAVATVKLDDRAVSEETLRGVAGFTFLYILFFVLTTLALSWMDLDFTTAASAAASALGNIDVYKRQYLNRSSTRICLIPPPVEPPQAPRNIRKKSSILEK